MFSDPDARGPSQARYGIDTRVRVLVDLPEKELRRGGSAVVCGKWHMTADVYEVEFTNAVTGEPCRALLSIEQIEPEPEDAQPHTRHEEDEESELVPA
ncbi:MAG: hypothetical protein QM770_09660 [Tepidisphaeraceae bacterium]